MTLAGAATARISADGVNPIKAAGVMSMIDNQVDKQTGTLTAKLTVPNLDEAVKWAARCPSAQGGSIELRPLGHTPDSL